MQPAIGYVVAAVLGAVVALGLFARSSSSSSSSSGRFIIQGGVRYWHPRETTRLREILGSLRATPHETDLVWILAREGLESALARAQAIQASGMIAAVTDNVFEARAPWRMLSAIAPDQLATKGAAELELAREHGAPVHVAILPPL